jgi:hypothetical protein
LFHSQRRWIPTPAASAEIIARSYLISARTRNYEKEVQKFLSSNNFKHVMMTISVKTCSVETLLKELILKSFMEGCVACKSVEPVTFSNFAF